MTKISTVPFACAAVMTMAAPAMAADKATGWKNWADHAERIVTAAESGDMSAIANACQGSTRTIISQGFQFPYWAQMLPQFCGVYKTENRKREVSMKEWRAECKELDSRLGSLEKAQPVAEEPRAEPLARHMVTILSALKVRECSKKPERERG
ncbi:hypothetical protein [uncultured Sphingomonas sp.]|uniref:hypothetical protein n=1 Tax=uncultured Sphingomonas sp. TaxID=158754 RepID=UPI0037493D03